MKKFINEEKLKHECGVFGVINSDSAAYECYLGLHSLQHRGQESSGITTISKNNFIKTIKKNDSIVTSFTNEDIKELEGNKGVGHVRYSTFGGTSPINIQPFTFTLQWATYITAHNGNIVNARIIRKELEKRGSIFFSFSDSEILGHLLNISNKKDILGKMSDSLKKLDGAFSFVVLTNDKLYGARDANGLRPLSLGKKDKAYFLASETTAFDAVGAEFIRDINPGEIVEISLNGEIKSLYFTSKEKTHNNMCAMEYIYFSRPDSNIEGINVHSARLECGKQLAKEHPVDADIVIGVPDSSISAALGYSKFSKIPFEIGLVKNKYIGRSFIAPSQEQRARIIKMKLNTNDSVLKNKRVVLVDDSIVRGTTMKGIVELIHNAGAKEIHIRISSPMLKWPCFYGVDISTKKELALNQFSKDGYTKNLKYATSLEFLSKEGLESSLNRRSSNNKLCTACFTGKYPTDLYGENNE